MAPSHVRVAAKVHVKRLTGVNVAYRHHRGQRVIGGDSGMTYGKSKETISTSLVILLVCLSGLAFNLQKSHSQEKQAGPGSHTLAVAVNGLERTYIIHVPATYKPQRPWPLVIMLHGGGGTAKAAMWETEWAIKAEKEGFLAVFPNALARDPAQPSSFARNP